jgi:hypothetical protein
MSERRSNWIWGIVYCNPEDKRVFVPMRSKLGLTINFGHPRALDAFAGICAIWLLLLVAAPIVVHPRWSIDNPSGLVCVLCSWAVAFAMLRLNCFITRTNHRLLVLTSLGVLAVGVGFSIQSLINTPLVLWWAGDLTWEHHLALGFVAAMAQTFGKWFAITLLLKIRPASRASSVLRYGLLVGFGFALVEIPIVHFQAAWSQIPVDYLSIWERSSSSLFHIYTTGLIGFAIATHRFWPIGTVVIIHAWTDFLAGAGGTLGISLYNLESIFSVCAILTWIGFVLAGRTIQRGIDPEPH